MKRILIALALLTASQASHAGQLALAALEITAAIEISEAVTLDNTTETGYICSDAMSGFPLLVTLLSYSDKKPYSYETIQLLGLTQGNVGLFKMNCQAALPTDVFHKMLQRLSNATKLITMFIDSHKAGTK